MSIATERDEIILRQRPSVFASLLSFARRKPLGAIGGAIVLLMIILAIFAPLLAPYDPTLLIDGGSARLKAPSLAFPMGTDNLGRDILGRVIGGERLSMMLEFLATLFGRCAGELVAWATGWREEFH